MMFLKIVIGKLSSSEYVQECSGFGKNLSELNSVSAMDQEVDGEDLTAVDVAGRVLAVNI